MSIALRKKDIPIEAKEPSVRLEPKEIKPPLVSPTPQIPQSIRQTKLRSSPSQLFYLMKLCHIKPIYFIPPTLCAFGTMLFETLTLALLYSLLKSMIDPSMGVPQNFPAPLNHALSFLLPKENNFVFYVTLISGLTLLSLTLRNASSYLGQLSLRRIVKKFVTRLQIMLFSKSLHFGKAYFDSNSLGKCHGIITQYTTQLGNTLPEVSNLIQQGILLVAYFIYLNILSWQLMLISLFLLFLGQFGLKWLRNKIALTSLQHRTAINEVNRQTMEVLNNIPLIKAYNCEAQESLSFRELSKTAAQLGYSMDKKQLFNGPYVEVLTGIVLLTIAASVSFLRSHSYLKEPASILLFFFIAKRAFSSFSAVSGAQTTFSRIKGYLIEVLNFLDDTHKGAIHSGNRVFNGLQREIRFQNLHFAYQPGIEVIRGLNLSIEKNKITALMGTTGAGKTTIASLIQRLYECAPASLYVDEVDIREYTLESLRERMAFVSQDTYLFSKSFRFNLSYGLKKEFSDEELYEALRKAQLDELVRSFPHGIDTPIGEKGVRLSGGEKQRLSIARAMLKNSEILVLDEATSSLDSRTEKLVQLAFDELTQHRTTIVIAHRLSTIRKADKIVVLEHGQVIEQGSFDELLAKKGHFFGYWNQQHEK